MKPKSVVHKNPLCQNHIKPYYKYKLPRLITILVNLVWDYESGLLIFN